LLFVVFSMVVASCSRMWGGAGPTIKYGLLLLL